MSVTEIILTWVSTCKCELHLPRKPPPLLVGLGLPPEPPFWSWSLFQKWPHTIAAPPDGTQTFVWRLTLNGDAGAAPRKIRVLPRKKLCWVQREGEMLTLVLSSELPIHIVAEQPSFWTFFQCLVTVLLVSFSLHPANTLVQEWQIIRNNL